MAEFNQENYEIMHEGRCNRAKACTINGKNGGTLECMSTDLEKVAGQLAKVVKKNRRFPYLSGATEYNGRGVMTELCAALV